MNLGRPQELVLVDDSSSIDGLYHVRDHQCHACLYRKDCQGGGADVSLDLVLVWKGKGFR